MPERGHCDIEVAAGTTPSKRDLSREYKAQRRDERRLRWRCFWTWPFGHLWGGDDRTKWECRSCGIRKSIIWKRRAS